MIDKKSFHLFACLLLSLFISACAANHTLRLADDYQQQERWDEAHRLYQEALKERERGQVYV